MADSTFRSLNTSWSRYLRPESGRLRKIGNSRWLFNQLHVKCLVFNIQSSLMLIGLFAMNRAIVMENYKPLDIPGFDGLKFLSTHEPGHFRPHELFSKNMLSIVSYLYFASAVLGFYGIQFCETNTPRLNGSQRKINPAHYLIPSAFSLLTFLYPLIILSLRTFKSASNIAESHYFSISIILDCIRFSFVPTSIFWIVYLYLLYGYLMGYSYHYRRYALRAKNTFQRGSLRQNRNKNQQKIKNSTTLSPFHKKEGQQENPRTTTICTSSPVQKLNLSLNHSRYLETVNEESD